MRLLHIYQPFMAAVTLVSKGHSQQAADKIRQQLTERWLQTTEVVAKQGWGKSWTDDAAFAICVWTDEQILLSPRAAELAWIPLQGQIFHTQCGGEEFFARLNTLFSRYELIEAQHPTRALLNDVLAVFGVCLALGFKGRYYNSDGAVLQQLQCRIADQLDITQASAGFDIVPHQAQQSSVKYWPIFDPFSLLLIGAALLGTLLVLLIYQDLLTLDLLQWPA